MSTKKAAETSQSSPKELDPKNLQPGSIQIPSEELKIDRAAQAVAIMRSMIKDCDKNGPTMQVLINHRNRVDKFLMEYEADEK